MSAVTHVLIFASVHMSDDVQGEQCSFNLQRMVKA